MVDSRCNRGHARTDRCTGAARRSVCRTRSMPPMDLRRCLAAELFRRPAGEDTSGRVARAIAGTLDW